jgi:hypothetical protein
MCLVLLAASCTGRKHGLLVEPSQELAQAGGSVRDWRREGIRALSIEVYSETPIPANSWVVTLYDKQAEIIATSKFNGPPLRMRDTRWLRFDFATDLDRVDRIILGWQPPSRPVEPRG